MARRAFAAAARVRLDRESQHGDRVSETPNRTRLQGVLSYSVVVGGGVSAVRHDESAGYLRVLLLD